MKRLLILFTVGLLASCGGVSSPETPVSAYPSIAGVWSDSDGYIQVCGETERTKMELTVNQSEADVTGTFAFRAADGSIAGDEYRGQVSSSGRFTGILGSGQESFDLELEATPYLISGTITSGALLNCVNGTQSRAIFRVVLERE